jgi:hypothetical protein
VLRNILSEVTPGPQQLNRKAHPRHKASSIGYAAHRSGSHDTVIRVYDNAGKVIETDRRGPGIYGSENVTEMSLLSAFKRLEDKRYAGEA